MDYKTKDSTCIRDYIHVTDIAKAYILAVRAHDKGKESSIYNLGNGKGYSVKEVIKTAKEITGREILTIDSPKRKGYPTMLVANSEKIIKELGWKPKITDLKSIIKTAWHWYCKHTDEYRNLEQQDL